MEKVKFKKKSTKEIEELEIENGSLIYDYETGKTYMDHNGERISTGGGSENSNNIYIGPTENAPEEAKLIIDPEEVKVKPNGVINSMEGNETDKSPSVHAVKEALKMIKGEIVWANPNPTQPTGKLTPDIDITEYDSYAVLCYGNTSKNALLNTGLIFKNNNTRLFYIDAGYPLYRVITCQNNLVNFESAARIKTLGNAELVDTVIIPAFVIGYKTQLLDSEVNG